MEGQPPVPPTSPPVSELSSPLTPLSEPSPTPNAAATRFTHATATTCHLPLLNELQPPTRRRQTRPSRSTQRPSSFTLSTDSSSDHQRAYILPKVTHSMSNTATVEPTSGKAPVLTNGDVTPSVMMEFENACYDFFEAKSVPNDKQVAFILPGIRDLRIRNWIAADRATIVTLPFATFMSQLRSNYLHPDWEDHVRDKILNSRLDPNKESFRAWSQNIIKLNCLLRNMTSVFDEATLRNQLDAHLDDGLKERVKHSDAKKEKSLKAWIDAVRRLDETRISENKRHRELIEETFNKCQAKRVASDNSNTFHNPSRRYNANTSTSSASTSNSNSTFIALPFLLNAERTLLNEHDGCTKCRKFYVGHRSCDCPTGFPPGKGYKTLTLADALAAKKGKQSTATTSTKTAPKTVAAMAPSSSDEPSTIAAVLPSASDSESGSDEDADISKRDVSAPLKSKHLVWNCQIHGLKDDFPVKIHALINNGAHVILIRPELVAELNLKKPRLAVLETVDVAMQNGQNSKSNLYEYVKLSLTSLDATWTSKTVKALIAPGLCMPVILRLPFLIHNNIITDHAARTCIDNLSNYDLLNPLPITPPPPQKLCLKEQLAEKKADKKLVLAELMLVCNDRFKNHKLRPQITEEFNVAGAIRERIEILATQEQLLKREAKLRSEFKQVFEPIPHVNELPLEVFALIHLLRHANTRKRGAF